MPQIKGAAIIDVLKWRTTRYGEKRCDQLLEFLNPETKKIFGERIISTEWYSVDEFIKFLEVDARELYKGNPEGLIGPAEEIIAKQLRGIYALFVRLGSPEFIIKRIATVNKAYFTGIDVRPEFVASGRVKIKYIGFEKKHYLFEYVLIGFYKKALEISGAKDVKVSISTSVAEGKGYSELMIRWGKEIA